MLFNIPIQALKLSSNRLTSLPEAALAALSPLTSLLLDSNRLAALPESLGGLSNLVRLDLGGNALTTLPDGIGSCTALRELRVARNQLAGLSESLGKHSGHGCVTFGTEGCCYGAWAMAEGCLRTSIRNSLAQKCHLRQGICHERAYHSQSSCQLEAD